ncbi:6-phosphogluconolactonase [Chryseobacterium sp. Leaf180]|uniref:6-phosphogluconolactonase n=1 Tax=Chryseobacterium sp. Leaf180 TaxID=1736289 RepID=UPI0009E8AACF|nr:6-phosphogluconolactonase [Chryseobacterium sp. Leaf180]
MMNLTVLNDTDELLNALAEQICESAEKAIRDHGRFDLVLSGGSSPKKLYELLASEKFKNRIEWNKIFFFFGDERFVPAGDSQRNSLMAREALFEPLNICSENIFEVDTTGTPQESAEKYWQDILKHFNGEEVEFDFILLGLGDNSHTASLFPHTSVLKETEASMKSIFVEEVEMYRITMTAPLINQAKEIAFLVFGRDKSEAVYHVLKEKNVSAEKYPGRLIDSDNEKVHWFLDQAAASKIV